MVKRPLIDTRPRKDTPARHTRRAFRRSAPSRPSKRAVGATERRAAIVAAGLEEFTAKGFAATRLDDVAKRAGVAKGTIYLHFQDKDALFKELVRTALDR
jgi:AcrR family transcriptional regulator